MNSFRVVISAAVENERDVAIHVEDEDGTERVMMTCTFFQQPELDQLFIDEMINKVAKMIGNQKLHWIQSNQKKVSKTATKKAVSDALQKITKG